PTSITRWPKSSMMNLGRRPPTCRERCIGHSKLPVQHFLPCKERASEVETNHMRKSWSRFARFQSLMLREEGQDLLEYAMVIALIAFATTAAMQAAAGSVGAAFTTIGAILTTATS